MQDSPSDDDSKSPEFVPTTAGLQEFEPLSLSATNFDHPHQHTSLFADNDEPVLNIEDEQQPVYRGVMAPPSLSYGAHNGHATSFEPLQASQGFGEYLSNNHELDNQGFGSIGYTHEELGEFSGFGGFTDFDKLDLNHYNQDEMANRFENDEDVIVTSGSDFKAAGGFPQVPSIADALGERHLENSRFVVHQPLEDAINLVQEYLQNQSIDFQWDAQKFLARCEAFSSRCSFHIRVMKDANDEHVVEFQRRNGCVVGFNKIVAQCRAVCVDGASQDMSQWTDCGMLDSDVDLQSLGALAPPSFAAWGSQSSHDEPSMDSTDDEQEAPPLRNSLEASAIMSLLSMLIAKGIDLQSDAAEKLARLSACPRSAGELWSYEQGQVLRCVEALCGLGAVDVVKTDACFDALSFSDLDEQRGHLVRNALAMLVNIAQSTDRARTDIVNSPLVATLGELLDKTDSRLHADLRRQSGRLLSLLSASHGASLASMLPLLQRNLASCSASDSSLKDALRSCVRNVSGAQRTTTTGSA